MIPNFFACSIKNGINLEPIMQAKCKTFKTSLSVMRIMYIWNLSTSLDIGDKFFYLFMTYLTILLTAAGADLTVSSKMSDSISFKISYS